MSVPHEQLLGFAQLFLYFTYHLRNHLGYKGDTLPGAWIAGCNIAHVQAVDLGQQGELVGELCQGRFARIVRGAIEIMVAGDTPLQHGRQLPFLGQRPAHFGMIKTEHLTLGHADRHFIRLILDQQQCLALPARGAG